MSSENDMPLWVSIPKQEPKRLAIEHATNDSITLAFKSAG
jgi:hypothetical protein